MGATYGVIGILDRWREPSALPPGVDDGAVEAPSLLAELFFEFA